MTAPTTYDDWNPARVDVVTLPELSSYFGIPEPLLCTCLYDDAFLRLFRLNERGQLVARVPDVAEYIDGAWN